MTDSVVPWVSIVTPSFNQAKFLTRNIETVQAQISDSSRFRLEHIVIDGGSTDGSREILQKFDDRLAYWVSEPDGGQSDALNKGFHVARGEIIGWLNSDDTYQPGAVNRVVEFFARNPDVHMVYGLCNMIDENDTLIETWDPPEFRLKWLLRLGVSCIPQPTAFFRREILEGVGLLEVNLHYAMDYDFFIRVGLKGYRIQKIPDVLANFRLYSTSKSVRDRKIHLEESKKVQSRYCHEPWLSWVLGFCGYKAHRAATKAGKLFFGGWR